MTTLVAPQRDATAQGVDDERQLEIGAWRTLATCGRVLARATSEEGLYRQLCQALTGERAGGCRMAWVALGDGVAPGPLGCAAQAGVEDGYLEQLAKLPPGEARDSGPEQAAIAARRPVAIQDIGAEPAGGEWPRLALARGYRGALALPIVAEGTCVGALTLFAASPGTFPEPVVAVLSALGEDVAMAALALRRRPAADRAPAHEPPPIEDRDWRAEILRGAAERERIEEALRESQDHYLALVRSLPIVEWTTDRDGVFTLSDGQGLAAIGLAPGEVVGRAVHEVYGDNPSVLGDFQRALAGESFVAENQIGPFLFESRWGPLRAADGAIVGVAGIALDITARRRAEEERARSQERFRALIEGSSDVLVVLDEAQRVQFWSPSATEALGWAPAEVLGRSVFEAGLIHPEDADELRRVTRALVARDGARERLRFRQRHRSGAWLRFEGSARNLLAHPAVKGVVINARDVTTQDALERQLVQAQRLESIGRLAGGVAHDFNNLLTVVLTTSEMLRQDLAAGLPAKLEDIDEIHAAGQRARDLTRQLLAFARKQVTTPLAIDLGAAVRSMEKLLRRLLGEDVELVVVEAAAGAGVLCDPGQLEQILVNLAVNARDAMPDGGVLRIETRLGPRPDGLPAGLAATPGEWVELTVSDSGTGMSEEVKEHLFEPFFTTKAVDKGTGLGLATVHGIVTQHGGSIRVESEPGSGARFRIAFPRVEPAAAMGPLPGRPRSARGRETVMVVEDEAQVRAATVRILRDAGYQVIAAEDGAAALSLLDAAGGRVDLLVSDVVMPGMSGPAALEALRLRQPGLRALFVSGYTPEVVATRVALDPSKLLLKPFSAEQLLERVRALLDAVDEAA